MERRSASSNKHHSSNNLNNSIKSIRSTRSTTRRQNPVLSEQTLKLKSLYHGDSSVLSSSVSTSSNKGNENKAPSQPHQQQKQHITGFQKKGGARRINNSNSSSSRTYMSPIKIMLDSDVFETDDALSKVTPDKKGAATTTTNSEEEDDNVSFLDDLENLPEIDNDETEEATEEPMQQPPPLPQLTPEEQAQKEARRAQWPLHNINEPGPNDCLFGRGGGTNHHPGNKRYRKMVEDKKEKYLSSKRLDKPLVAMEIINDWRALDPPGRFLKQDERTKLWNDVGDRKAREKTSQALREKSAPKLGEDGYEEHHGQHGRSYGGGGFEGYDKETRFETGTVTHVARGQLARDHSLGTEIIDGKDFSMEGFSWDELDNAMPPSLPPTDPAVTAAPAPYPYVRENSLSQNPLPGASASHTAPPNAFGHPSYYHPPHFGHPHPPPSPYGPPPPHHLHLPPPHHYQYYQGQHHYRATSDPPSPSQRDREHSLSKNPLQGANTSKPAPNTFDDERAWGRSMSYDSRAPPPPYYGYPSYHPHYGHLPPPPQFHPVGRPAPQSAFARYDADGRTHSMHSNGSRRSFESLDVQFYDEPAGTSQDFTKIANLMSDDGDGDDEKRSGGSIERANSWSGSERKQLASRDTSIGTFAPGDVQEGGDSGVVYEDTIRRSQSMPHSDLLHDASIGDFPSPPDNFQGRKKPETVEKAVSPIDETKPAHVRKPSLLRKLSGGGFGLNNVGVAAAPNGVCRPEPVKRDTSNQPESLETKRSIKRVVLSRDKSAISRSLKEEQQLKGDRSGVSSTLSKGDMVRNLSVEINKLGLGDRGVSLIGRMTTEDVVNSLIEDDVLGNTLNQPSPLDANGRATTIDAIAMDMASGRAQSCEVDDALNLMLENDPVATGTAVDPSAMNEDIAAKWINKGDATADV
jgi:hypothetical protein